jgi:hypothetical protein
MLIELLKWLPCVFLGACIGLGAQEITGWKYGFAVGFVAWACCEYMTRLEFAQHVQLVRRLAVAEALTKKQNDATDGDAGGKNP